MQKVCVLFDLMAAVLTEASREIYGLPWTTFARDYRGEDDGGPKYQGFSFCLHVGRERRILELDTLRDPSKSRHTLGRKLNLLLPPDHNYILASIERRNPEIGDWGGSIRLELQGHPIAASALTGFPEIVDHLVNSHLAYLVGAISESRWMWLVSRALHGIVQAMGYVGMSPDQFDTVNEQLWSMLKAAYSRGCS